MSTNLTRHKIIDGLIALVLAGIVTAIAIFILIFINPILGIIFFFGVAIVLALMTVYSQQVRQPQGKQTRWW